ncbi:hypothetical protein MKX03_024373, partial [Papaver bracteatum]
MLFAVLLNTRKRILQFILLLHFRFFSLSCLETGTTGSWNMLVIGSTNTNSEWCTGSQADLYHVMIYMFLSPTEDLGENQLFCGQKMLQ